MLRTPARLLTPVLLLLASLLPVQGARAAPPAQEVPAGVNAPLGSGFTFQGRLDKAGEPVSATCAMTFDLWDAAAGGAQIGATQSVASVMVNEGLFTVLLNGGGQFGANAFNGQARFLETGVLCSGDTLETTLPRQQLTATPYALTAISAISAQTAQSAQIAQSAQTAQSAQSAQTAQTAASAAGLQGRPVDSAAPANGQVLSWNGSAWVPATSPAADWNALLNKPAGFADGVDNEGWALGGNADATAASRLGTTAPVTLTLIASSTTAMRLIVNPGTPSIEVVPNVVGGSAVNIVGPAVQGAVIAGGGRFFNSFAPNSVFDSHGAIAGGIDNEAGTNDGDPNSQYSAFVGGGFSNEAAAEFSVIGGGRHNASNASLGAILGGQNNIVNTGARFSSIPGGLAAVTRHYGQFAHAGGQFNSVGDAQVSTYILRNVSNSSVTRTLYLDCNEVTNTNLDTGTPCNSGEEITIPDGRAMAFRVTVVAIIVSSGNGSLPSGTYAYMTNGLVRNIGGTTVQNPFFLGTPVEIGDTNTAANFNVAVFADNTTDVLRVAVTGATDVTLRWVASVEAVEVATTSVAAAGMENEVMEGIENAQP